MGLPIKATGQCKSTSELEVVVPKPASLLKPVLAGMLAVTSMQGGGVSCHKGKSRGSDLPFLW